MNTNGVALEPQRFSDANVDPVRIVLDRLPGYRKTGEEQYEARCPAHEDNRASLSIGVGDDGKVLLHCHAGCETSDVARAMELAAADLFPAKLIERRIVAGYSYADEAGAELFEVVRFEPKDFRQRHRGENGEWLWKMNGVRRVLYRLPELRSACAAGASVWIGEGEKDVETLRAAGLTSTCNPGGAGKWRPEYAEALKGASAAFIIPDNDAPGRAHAEAVARALLEVVPLVKVVEVAGGVKDVTEWMGRGGTVERLTELAIAAPVFGAPTLEEMSPRPRRTMKDLMVPLTAELLRTNPPAREYIVFDAEGRGVLPRARVGMLGAPGGTGKSKTVNGLAVAVASGGKWFDAWQCQRGRVLLVLAEEDRDEALRRLHYALRSATDEEIADVARNVTLLPAAGEGLALTYEKDAATGGLPETSRAAELRAMLRAAAAEGNPYALVVLDPSSRFAGADVERDNAAATRYVQVLETFTAPDCGSPNVLLTAHTRKRGKNDEPGSTDALRGASGQRDGARWVAMLERRQLIDGAPKLLDLIISKTNYGVENSIVLVAQDDLEGALRAATPAEIEQYSSAASTSRVAESSEKRDTGLRDSILTELTARPLSGNAIAERIHAKAQYVQQACKALQGDGLIERRGGRKGVWALIPTDSRTDSRSQCGIDSTGSAPKGAGTGTSRKSVHIGSDGNHSSGCRCDTCREARAA